MDILTVLQTSTYDIIGFLLSALFFVAYHIYFRHKIALDPAYSVQSVNRIVRTAWVETIMNDEKNGVLAVQTLRNSTMAATFSSPRILCGG